jgi:5'-nucleotidase
MTVRVLLTNDDVVGSPGLRALAEAFAPIYETTVVAPEQERSASGHSVTLHKPLRAKGVVGYPDGVAAWATNGTPADCVVLGVMDLMTGAPNLVVSGINLGANLGRDVTYSGTVSGAMEGTILKIPSMAISVAAYHQVRFDVATGVALTLARAVLERALPPDALLNVNVPNLGPDEIKGIAITRQGTRRYLSALERRTDPRGRPYYWLTGDRDGASDEPGSDAAALAAGYVSVTPIHLNMTDDRLIDTLVEWKLTVR